MIERPRNYALKQLVAVAMSAATGAAIALGPIGGVPAHSIAALALVLVLPGAPFALVTMDFSGALERAAVAIALSISITALLTLGLDATGVALGSTAWITGLLGATIVTCLLAAVLPHRDARFAPSASHSRRTGWRTVLVAVAALMVAGAGLLTGLSTQAVDEDFTSLWAVPGPGRSVVIGVTNEGGTARTYRIKGLVDGKTIVRVAPFSLESGETWKQPQIKPDAGNSEMTFELTSALPAPAVDQRVTLSLR